MEKVKKVKIYCNKCGKATGAITGKTRFCSERCSNLHFRLFNTYRLEYYKYLYHTKIKNNPKLMEKRRKNALIYSKLKRSKAKSKTSKKV